MYKKRVASNPELILFFKEESTPEIEKMQLAFVIGVQTSEVSLLTVIQKHGVVIQPVFAEQEQ